MQKFTKLRVFLACPGDATEEKERLAKVIESLQSDAERQACVLELLEWRSCVPDLGKPQDVIFAQLKPGLWDIFIGILWTRLGSPSGIKDKSGRELTGTEAELLTAIELHQSYQRPRVLIYRSTRSPKSIKEVQGAQLAAIEGFINECDKSGKHPALIKEYGMPDEFERLVSEHLRKELADPRKTRKRVSISAGTKISSARSDRPAVKFAGSKNAAQSVGLNGGFVEPSARLEISVPKKLSKTMIRFSISGLFRISVGDQFLLVLGNRIPKYHPVGGVFKRCQSAIPTLEALRVQDDDGIPIDKDSRFDLRVRVPGYNANEFLKWFRSQKGRETHPWREFYEELITPKILEPKVFPFVATEHLHTYISGLQWSSYLQRWEVLISEIYSILPNRSQFAALKKLQRSARKEIRWATANAIRSRGVVPGKRLVSDIGDNAEWIL